MDVSAAARHLLQTNTQSVRRDGRVRTFTVPSLRKYPFQWFWDSCFHAIVWSSIDVERAKEELRSLVSVQDRDGFLPHIIFWDQRKVHRSPFLYHWQESMRRRSFLPFTAKPRTSALIQPPVLAQAVQRVWNAGNDRTFLAEMLPVLDRYFTWLGAVRDPDDDGLIVITSPYESGLDASPAYDDVLGIRPSMRRWRTLVAYRIVPFMNKVMLQYNQPTTVALGRFHVADVLVNAIYALNLSILGQLHGAVGNHDAERRWTERSKRTLEALIGLCWDERRGMFFNLDGHELKRNTVAVIQGLFPLILPSLPATIATRLVDEHLTNPAEFWPKYPVPSVALSEPSFSSQSFLTGTNYRLLWRGPSWINTNWFLIHGLRQHGYEKDADTLATKTKALVERSGFREYYDPVTGEGLGEKGFGWSTLASDLDEKPVHRSGRAR